MATSHTLTATSQHHANPSAPPSLLPTNDHLNGLKRALGAWEQAFKRANGRNPTAQDVRQHEIAKTYREYEQMKKTLANMPTSSTSASTTAPLVHSSGEKLVTSLPAASKPTTSLPPPLTPVGATSQRTPANSIRVHAAKRTNTAIAAAQARRTQPVTRPSIPPARAHPITTTSTILTKTAVAMISSDVPPIEPVVACIRPNPAERSVSSSSSSSISLSSSIFCAGPRHVAKLLATKKNQGGLFAQLQSPPSINPIAQNSLPKAPSVEDELKDADRRQQQHRSYNGDLRDSDYSSDYDSNDDIDTDHRVRSYASTSVSPLPHDDIDMDLDGHQSDTSNYALHSAKPGNPPTPVSSPPLTPSHTVISLITSSLASSSNLPRKITAPSQCDDLVDEKSSTVPRTRAAKRTRQQADDDEDQGYNESNESYTYESYTYDDTNHAQGVDDFSYSSDDDDADSFDEDTPIVPSVPSSLSSSAPTSAKVSAKRAPRASKLKVDKPKKPSNGLISTNYVRHDTHRKNGIRAGPKSGKALRAARWREIQGKDRWKSKSEWKREKEQESENGLYCEVLEPKELKNIINNVVSSSLSGGDDTDDDLAAYRQFEREQFGVGESEAGEGDGVDGAIDPLSPEAIAAEQKKRAIRAQTVATINAQTKITAIARSDDSSDTITDDALLAILREQFKYQQFRPGQLDTIKRLLANTSNVAPNVLSIMPTGGGKSLIYQFLSLLLPGLTLVISPLLSLMKV